MTRRIMCALAFVLSAALGMFASPPEAAASDVTCSGLIGGQSTDAQRMAGDTRPSLQQRYGSTAGYVNAVTTAVNQLVSDRLMLASDAPGAISNATAWFTAASKGMLP
jgi:hypothetical protein